MDDRVLRSTVLWFKMCFAIFLLGLELDWISAKLFTMLAGLIGANDLGKLAA